MLNVRFDAAGFIKALDKDKKQLLFATQLGINRTLEERQDVLRKHARSKLSIRSATAANFFDKAIQFARADRADVKNQPMAGKLRILGVETAATTDVYRRFGSFLLRQNDGGLRTNTGSLYRTQRNTLSAEGFILPAPGLRTATKGVSRTLYPAAIGLSTRQAIAGGREFSRQYKGGAKKRGGFKKGTKYFFVKEGVGIFMRQQLGKESEYDAVWFFRRQINLPKRLDLESTFIEGLDDQLSANIAGFYDFALRTAK